MQEPQVTFTVRPIDTSTSIIAVRGDLNILAENALMDAYAQANGPNTQTIILDFTALDYMNSGGIGLLAMLLIRMQRQHQRLLAFGLNEHYRHIMALSRMDEAIKIYNSEAAALEGAA